MGEGDDNEGDTDQDEIDLDKTPTKPRTKCPKSTRYHQLPTPPLSSPTEMTDAVRRMELIRMQSDLSTTSSTSIATETSITSDDTRPSNPYKFLKSFLRLSSSTSDETDQIIVGRAPEKHILKQYLVSQETEVGMYISGPPGTGKTALVTAMGRDLARQQGWNVVEFGCMGLKPADMWKRLAEGLGCGGSESEVRSHLETANNTYVLPPLNPFHSGLRLIM